MIWKSELAAHLLRRAAFGGTTDEIARAQAEGCEKTVERLLAISITPGDNSSEKLDSFSSIQRWWVARMMRSARPLEERMTFFWHNHFATSIVTVERPELMVRQNLIFRAHAFSALVGGGIREHDRGTRHHPALGVPHDADERSVEALANGGAGDEEQRRAQHRDAQHEVPTRAA